MTDAFRPDLVIAIDFGMTCTGVAFCNISTGEETVRWLQKWPGRSNAVENKVPTLLVYPNDVTTPSSWGFLSEKPAEQMSDEKECKEWFKTFLDEDRLLMAQRESQGQNVCPASIDEVERLCRDFFRFLYTTIQQKLEGELASRWEDAKIEFIFSVPTTWKPTPTVERFRSTFEQAGFGKFPNHRAIIGLTEAEAAAVHTARVFPRIFNDRDVLLVCDVGGGTTDLCVLRVLNSKGADAIELEQMDIVQGATIGSVQLDEAFELSVRERLEIADNSIPMELPEKELDDMAWEMAKSKEYQNAKCEYGIDDDTEFFTVALPRLRRGYANEQAGINYGEMRFRRTEIKHYFDIQIEKLFDLIDKQFARLQYNLPGVQIAHLVLSGGLGNSAYVQTRLRQRYSSGHSPFFNAKALQIRVAPEPQLVVCKGIVADRVQKIRHGTSMLGWRCSRSSYGTICKVLFDENNPAHQGHRTQLDTLDGKSYVSECINWFIKKGEPVSTDYPIIKPFTRKCPRATGHDPNPHRAFGTGVITCDLEAHQLPLVMDSSCRYLCEINSDLSSLPLSLFKLKNRHWWQSGSQYHRIEYVIKVNLGPADISFELWYAGRKISGNNSIVVEWAAAAPPSILPEQRALGGMNGGQWMPAAGGGGGGRTGGGVLGRRAEKGNAMVRGLEGGNVRWET
ncbi:hypothetical protein BJ875DRAFT_190386 [Amylocarpus encephaloides]|uniref:Uncharacterized protein n=1 Tax=Amylocarpus encephaloides TaxID=45428 RepID=A0A9P7YPV9_9HELO|nr:hypothetical protein BJ875DRAFT_190386 [Amylocarpus encephaloides]